MLTLTVDPKLFSSPQEAYAYVCRKRSIAELVKALHKMGLVKSTRFFSVVEWHENGWAHWHVLVEAEFVDFKEVARLWGLNRPKSAPEWEGDYSKSLKGHSPEFGTVRVSRGKFSSPEHAANYAMKYMVKYPEHGYPAWVEECKRLRRFSTSRGLLPPEREPKEDKRRKVEGAGVAHSAECFCDSCREGSPKHTKSPQRTIGERRAVCGTQAAVLQVTEHKTDAGLVVKTSRKFWKRLELTFAQVLTVLDCSEVKQRWVVLREGDLARIGASRGYGFSVVGGDINPSDVAREAAFDAWNSECGGIVL